MIENMKDAGRFYVTHAGRLGAGLMAAFMLAACSDDPTGPQGTGGVQAFMADGSNASSSQMAPSFQSQSADSQHGGSYSGSFDANARVEISADGETWVELGPPASVNVGLRAAGDRAEVHGEAEVPVGMYTHVRLVLQGAQATLNAGSSIGGLSLTAAMTMQIGANGDVTVERQVPPFEVTANTRTEITWNLNSHLWVNEENAEEEEVDEEEFEQAPEPTTERYPREST